MHGHHKGAAAYGYTRQLGYHPPLATRADTGEVLHAQQRTGRAASGRGAERFVNEIAGRVRRAGEPSPVDRRKQGLKRSVAVEAGGIPLAAVPAPANPATTGYWRPPWTPSPLQCRCPSGSRCTWMPAMTTRAAGT